MSGAYPQYPSHSMSTMSLLAAAPTANPALGSNSNGASAGFPLRPNFFRSLPLELDTRARLYEIARQNASTCLHHAFNQQWRFVPPEKDGTQIRKDTSNLSASFRFVRAATALRCQEHEFRMVVSNTTTESWRRFLTKCVGRQCIDTMILHSFTKPKQPAEGDSDPDAEDRMTFKLPGQDEDQDLQPCRTTSYDQKDPQHAAVPTAEDEKNPHFLNDARARANRVRQSSETVSLQDEELDAVDDEPEMLAVKWGVFEVGLGGKKDVCILDYVTTAVVPQSEPKEIVHAWTWTSVEGERVGCMSLRDSHSIPRAKLSHLGIFWRALGTDETEVVICGSFPSKHARRVGSLLIASLQRLQVIVEELRMSHQMYLHREMWIQDEDRSSCLLCMRNFNLVRRKHHCRRCGEVLCSDCSVVSNVDLPVIGYARIRLCKVCSLKAKSTPLKPLGKINVFDQLERARSISDASSPFSGQMARGSFADTGSSSTHAVVGIAATAATTAVTTTRTSTPMLQDESKVFADMSMNVSVSSCGSLSSFSTSSNTLGNEVDVGIEVMIDERRACVHPMSNTATTAGLGTKELRRSSDSAPLLRSLLHDPECDDFLDIEAELDAIEIETQRLADQHPKRTRQGNSNMFELLCELACQTLNCPIAAVSMINAKGESIRSMLGLNTCELDEELALFISEIMGDTPTVVLDAYADPQAQQVFSCANHGEPLLRFFAGCPIFSQSGVKLGYVCVADRVKRDSLGTSCAFTMERLATLAVTTLERNLQRSCEDASAGDAYASPHVMDRARQRHNNSLAGAYPSMYRREMAEHCSEMENVRPSPRALPPPPPVGMPPVAPLPPRSYAEYTSAYYEAQDRMRKLLLKSYNTQQTLAGGVLPTMRPSPSASSSSWARFNSN